MGKQKGMHQNLTRLYYRRADLVSRQGRRKTRVVHLRRSVFCVGHFRQYPIIEYALNTGQQSSLEFVIWFVPSLIGNAVAISIVGVFLGPMYPIVINQTSRILPRWILTGAIGWIAGFGQAGSALFPFITGAVAERHGIKSLQPLWVSKLWRIVHCFADYVWKDLFRWWGSCWGYGHWYPEHPRGWISNITDNWPCDLSSKVVYN